MHQKDVLKCHPYLTGNDTQKGRSDIESLGNPLPMRVERSADQSKGNKEAERGETSSERPPNGQPSIDMRNRAEVLSKQLFETSEAIVCEFLPKDGHSSDHVVCTRFWGTVDENLRLRACYSPETLWSIFSPLKC